MFHPISPLHFLPEFVPHTEFKGRPEDTKWNVLYHTALRNYAAISLQVPSILSILLGCENGGARACGALYTVQTVMETTVAVIGQPSEEFRLQSNTHLSRIDL
jgi:hypothetical protein